MGVDVVNRLRVGFALTTILGGIYAAVGLFDSLTQLTIGVVLACIGLIGSGAVEWVDR